MVIQLRYARWWRQERRWHIQGRNWRRFRLRTEFVAVKKLQGLQLLLSLPAKQSVVVVVVVVVVLPRRWQRRIGRTCGTAARPWRQGPKPNKKNNKHELYLSLLLKTAQKCDNDDGTGNTKPRDMYVPGPWGSTQREGCGGRLGWS